MIEVTKNYVIKASGTIMDLINDTAYIIHGVYDGISDEDMKEFYKYSIITSLLDDRSPVFKTATELTDESEECSQEALERLTNMVAEALQERLNNKGGDASEE